MGRRLASLREEQGRSVADVAAAMKLSRSTIESIEADRFERIAPIYRRGYIANYARELGVPADRFVDPNATDEPPPLKGVLPPPAPTDRVDRFVRFATYFLVTTLIVPPLVYFFVTGGTRLFDFGDDPGDSGPPSLVAGEGLGSEGSAGAGDRPEGAREGVTRRIARALSLDNGDPDADGPLSASTLPLSPLRAGDASIDSGVLSDAEQSAGTPSDGARITGSSSSPRSSESNLHPIVLELLEDSWVEINDARGERLEFDLLRAGTRRSYEAQPPVRVLVGRGSAVELSFDGEAVRFEGADRGSVAEFTLEAPAGGARGPVDDGPAG
ncbi:RodZ domain-containing protein [Halomonas denitrificans]|nr:DUF4115 domain-containing protein [Halomonas denitrificans]